jgi:hypothetical protein
VAEYLLFEQKFIQPAKTEYESEACLLPDGWFQPKRLNAPGEGEERLSRKAVETHFKF